MGVTQEMGDYLTEMRAAENILQTQITLKWELANQLRITKYTYDLLTRAESYSSMVSDNPKFLNPHV